MNINEWEKFGGYEKVGEHNVFVIDAGKSDNTILILHGYPTSSYDFHKVITDLSKNNRVIIHDHLGFGYSDKPQNYSYSIFDQTDTAIQLWKKLGIESAHLVAHDYGTTVATELITRRNLGNEPIKLKSVTLCNGSVHIEFAKLRIIQKLLQNKKIGPIIARLSSKRIFSKNIKNLWHDKTKIDSEDIDSKWELLNQNNGKLLLPKLTQYLTERKLFWNRWVGALKETDVKTNILWGRYDPVTGEDIAKLHHEEIANSRLKIIDNTGHYPMLESPEDWSTFLLKMID